MSPRRPASGIPAGGAGTPFPKGNAVATRNGARSPRVYGELAAQLAAGLVEDRPDLAAYPEAVGAWAQAEAQAALLRRDISENGTFAEDGAPRASSLNWLRAFERLAMKHREVLGLDPKSEASLARERAAASVLAVDLQALAERGAAALAEREAAGVTEPDAAGDALREALEAAPVYAPPGSRAAKALEEGR